MGNSQARRKSATQQTVTQTQTNIKRDKNDTIPEHCRPTG